MTHLTTTQIVKPWKPVHLCKGCQHRQYEDWCNAWHQIIWGNNIRTCPYYAEVTKL